jgi:hypothetical protein
VGTAARKGPVRIASLSNRRATLVAVLLLLAGAPSAGAAPRVTLRLENGSLHQYLRALSRQAGVEFQSPEGAGSEDYRDPPNAARASLAWENAPLGRAVRDVSASFGLSIATADGALYRVEPAVRSRPPAVTAGGVQFSLLGLRQREGLTAIPGAAGPEVRRTVSLALRCRAEDGSGELLGSVSRLALIDASGARHEARLPLVPDHSAAAAPDERIREVAFAWDGPHAASLQAIEGELTRYTTSREERLSLKLSAGGSPTPLPSVQEFGGASAQVTAVEWDDGEFRARAAVEWKPEAAVASGGPDGVRFTLLTSDGRRGPVPAGASFSVSPEGLRRLDFTLVSHPEAEPRELIVTVPVRSGRGASVPFRIENVAAPFGKPQTFRLAPMNVRPPVTAAEPARTVGVAVMAPFRDLEGGTLCLPGLAGPADAWGEVAVGLSRRGEDGSWSPVRWQRVEVSADAPVLERVAPGAYRVRLRYFRRLEDGSLRRDPSLDREGTATVRKGAAADLDPLRR